MPRVLVGPRTRSAALLFAVTALLTSCPPGSGAISSSWSYSATSPALFIEPGSAESDTVNISGLTGHKVIVARLNETESDFSASSLDTIAANPSLGTAPVSTRAQLFSADVAGAGGPQRMEPEIPRHWLETHPVTSETPSLRTALSRTFVGYGAPASTLVSYATNSSSPSTNTFTVYNDSFAPSKEATPAVLAATSTDAYVWVDPGVWNSGSADNGINLTLATAVAAKFDQLYAWVNTVFGYERGGGPAGDGGIDGDQHISILIYAINADQTSDHGFVGFFHPVDETTSTWSNQREMFYIDAHFLAKYPEIVYSTLAHEYQHMISYAQKALKGYASSSAFDEMFSMVAEDLVASGDKLDNPLPDWAGSYSSAAHPAFRLPDFASFYDEKGLPSWSMASQKSTLLSYAWSYSFGSFLLRNFGGPRLFSDFMTQASANSSALEASLGIESSSFSLPSWLVPSSDSSTKGTLFSDLTRKTFRSFVASLAFAPSPVSGAPTHNVAGSQTVGATSYSWAAIDTSKIPWRETYDATVSTGTGTRLFSLQDAPTLTLPSGGFTLFTDGDWWPMTQDSLTLTVTRGQNHGKLPLAYAVFVLP